MRYRKGHLAGLATLFAAAAAAATAVHSGLIDTSAGAGSIQIVPATSEQSSAQSSSSPDVFAAAAVTDSVTITSANAVARPTLGFGINWPPYWDKPAGYDGNSSPNTPLALTDAEWLTILNRQNYISNSSMRVMVLPGWVNPTASSSGNDYTDAGMVHAMYRNLDYAKAHGITTAIGYWDARPPFDGNEGGTNYIKSLGDLTDYLVNTKGYTNIKYVILANEPQHRFSSYTDYKTAVQALHTQLQRPSLAGKVSVMGPDVGGDGTSWLASTATDMAAIFKSYEWHDYPAGQTAIKDTSAGSQLKTLAQSITTADPDTSKPLVLGEMGWFYGVTASDDQPHIGEYQYGVEVSDLGIQGSRNGWSSIAWYLDDQTNDKLWGMWDIKNSPALRPWFYPWSLLTRAFRPGMTLYNPADPTDIRILAGKQVVSGSNRWSIALANRRTTDAVVNLAISGEGTATLSRFVYAPGTNAQDGNGFPLPADQVSGNLASGIQITVPANAIVVVTNIPQSTDVDDSMTGSGMHQWSFGGTWSVNNATQTGEFNRSTTSSATTNNTATVAFTGTGLRFYAHRGTGGGYGAISVDGGAETNVSFYNPSADGNVLLWSTSGLTFGQHSVRFRVTGTHPAGSSGNAVAIDRLEVLN